MAHNAIPVLKTPTKKRRGGEEAQQEEAEMVMLESTYLDIETRRKANVKAERAPRKRAEAASLSSSRKKLLLKSPAASPIKVRVARSNMIDLDVLWTQNIASRLLKLVDEETRNGCDEGTFFGEDPRASRLSKIYADLVFAFSPFEVMLGGKDKLTASIHDLFADSPEQQMMLVDEGLWLPKDQEQLSQWTDYLTHLTSGKVSLAAIPAKFVTPMIYIIARIQRAMVDFLDTVHSIKMKSLFPISSYM